MHDEQHSLHALLAPQSIAIIGASETEGTVGRILTRNMLDMNYRGQLFFVNPKYTTLYGQPCYPGIEAVPQRIDLAAICTPARTLPDIIDACGRAGTRSAFVVAAGFAESGAQGAALERRMLEQARRHRLRLLGPNCLGLMRPAAGINLTYTHSAAVAGGIGLISQSGALCTALLDWAQANAVGFSSVVALGTSSDVDFGEILDYMASDPQTRAIFLYIEGIRNARRFMSALRAAARCKPVLLIKVGRHPAGSQAALTHSGAIAGNDEVFATALRRAGVVRLATVSQMFATARALYGQFQPQGKRLLILTNGGGLGAMAADHAADIDIELAQLSPRTQARLDLLLPQAASQGWSQRNPVDIGGEATPELYAGALKVLLNDEQIDGVLIILAPQACSDPTQTARLIIEQASTHAKPVITCWMGEAQVSEARLLFRGAGIPCFRTPEPAVELFSQLSNYFRNRQLLLQTPAASNTQLASRIDSARLLLETALDENRTNLHAMEAKALLAAFRIPVAQALLARSLNEALVLAEDIGLPVSLKVDAPLIRRKSLCGGVRLNLANLTAVRDAYHGITADVLRNQPDTQINGITVEPMVMKPAGRELALRVTRDPVFGPVISLCSNHPLDPRQTSRNMALPPLDSVLIDDLLRSSSVIAATELDFSAGTACHAAMENLLLRLSEMVCELPELESLDINPLIIDETGAVVVDARIQLCRPNPLARPYEHMAIHPYPVQLASCFRARNGRTLDIRPTLPQDSVLQQAFVQKLSSRSRYFRFMNAVRELTPAQLVRLTQIDYDREMALIALPQPSGNHTELMQVGEARYAINPDGNSCEFAVVVADDWQGQGLAFELMNRLIHIARSHAGLKTMNGDFLQDNQAMINLASRLGFAISNHPEDSSLKRGVLALI